MPVLSGSSDFMQMQREALDREVMAAYRRNVLPTAAVAEGVAQAPASNNLLLIVLLVILLILLALYVGSKLVK